MTEIVERSDLGIDLHSAAIHRTNLPQIRVSPASDATIRYADAFGAPVVMISKLRDGSLRKAAQERGVDVLLFEGGEGLRFDELSARAGLAGILRVMNAMGMVAKRGIASVREAPVHARMSSWVRAPAGGLLRTFKAAGEYVEVGDLLGRISDPFGEIRMDVLGEADGIIVGRTNLPFVHEGDALFHIAKTTSADVEMRIDMIANQLDGDPMFDEDEII